MYPTLSFALGRWAINYPTESLLFYLAIVVTFCLFYKLTKISFWKIAVLFGATISSALLGSRLLHLLWERKLPLSSLSWALLSDYQGMVLYGGIVLGMLAFALTARLLVGSIRTRAKLWNAAAVVTCLTIAILRVGCFVQGCCWGKLCPYKWAVRYTDDRAIMPLLGIPVHPVQLYEAFLCFCFFIYLLVSFLRNEKRTPSSQLKSHSQFEVFLLGYSLIRFFTEYFRGDFSRGTDLIAGLSTSQLISMAIVFCVVIYHYLLKNREKVPTLSLAPLR